MHSPWVTGFAGPCLAGRVVRKSFCHDKSGEETDKELLLPAYAHLGCHTTIVVERRK